jgi:hypothetical protein
VAALYSKRASNVRGGREPELICEILGAISALSAVNFLDKFSPRRRRGRKDGAETF